MDAVVHWGNQTEQISYDPTPLEDFAVWTAEELGGKLPPFRYINFAGEGPSLERRFSNGQVVNTVQVFYSRNGSSEFRSRSRNGAVSNDPDTFRRFFLDDVVKSPREYLSIQGIDPQGELVLDEENVRLKLIFSEKQGIVVPEPFRIGAPRGELSLVYRRATIGADRQEQMFNELARTLFGKGYVAHPY